jgi:all-trans-retinol 13,14-reductase
MTIGTQLRRASIESSYDSIVIGSGMGGLTAACVLAKAGHKVLVLERHYTAGGFTHTFARRGFEWDVGVHYIGEVHRKNSTMRRIFDYISDSGIKWSEMAPVYDRIWIGSESFDYVKGEKDFRAKMIQYFPREEGAINAYLKLIREVVKSSSGFYLSHVLPNFWARLIDHKAKSPFLKYASQTTEQVLKSLTNDPKLIAVLCAQWGDYGLPPGESSFAMHAMVAKHYLSGASYPVGGSSRIAFVIAEILKKYQGQVVTGAEVSSIVIEGQKATGVLLADGRRISGKNIISSVGVFNTVEKLLPDSCPAKKDFLKKMESTTRSIAHLCLYIGVKGDIEELGIPTSNLWIYPHTDFNASFSKLLDSPHFEFPLVYVSFPSSKDPTWKERYPGKSTIEIVAPARYDLFHPWDKKKWKKRGSDYERLKADLTERLLKVLLERYPVLKNYLAYSELSTPLSTAHFGNYQKGEIYGLNHTPKRFEQDWLRPETPIKNFYLTGQDIVTCGIGGALCSGVLTGMRVLGFWKSRKLLKIFQ